jgi:hypothetical protein
MKEPISTLSGIVLGIAMMAFWIIFLNSFPWGG